MKSIHQNCHLFSGLGYYCCCYLYWLPSIYTATLIKSFVVFLDGFIVKLIFSWISSSPKSNLFSIDDLVIYLCSLVLNWCFARKGIRSSYISFNYNYFTSILIILISWSSSILDIKFRIQYLKRYIPTVWTSVLSLRLLHLQKIFISLFSYLLRSVGLIFKSIFSFSILVALKTNLLDGPFSNYYY